MIKYMFNIKFCILLVIGIFLVFSAPVLGEFCEINTISTQFVPYDMSGMTLFTMPEYLSTGILYRVDLLVSNNNCSNVNNTVNITVSICGDSCKIYEFYNRTLQNTDNIPLYSHFLLPEKPYSYLSPSSEIFIEKADQIQENPISFPEEGNYTINIQFFNNKNEVQHNNTIHKKVSLLENNIILFSSLSSIIFSGVNFILTIAIILLSSFSFIEIFKLMYYNIFKKIEDGKYDDAINNILKPLFYLYSLYLVTSFLINLLVSPSMLLHWISNNIEWFIILFAFYSLLFTRKLRNYNIICILFALYLLGTFINDITTNVPYRLNNESLFRDGFFSIIITYSSILIVIISGAVYILSIFSIMFFIVIKTLNPEKIKKSGYTSWQYWNRKASLIKINFRNKKYKHLMSLLPDFISFYLVYVILKYLYLYPYSGLLIIFTIFLLTSNIFIKKIMEIEKLSIKSLRYYIISFFLLFLSLIAIDRIMFKEKIMMSYYRSYTTPYSGLLDNMDTMMSYNYWLYDAIILITVIWFYYICKNYSRNISYFIHKHFSRFNISK